MSDSALLPCGHPVACEGMAGESADKPGCGWCADLSDLSMLVDHLSRTYDHFSGGMISKPNTHPEEVFAIASALQDGEIEQAVAEALEEAGK